MPALPSPDRPRAPAAPVSVALRRLAASGPGLALGYCLALLGLVSVSHLLWFLPAGLRPANGSPCATTTSSSSSTSPK